MNNTFAELFEESTRTIEMAPGSIIMGTVVDISDEFVTMHVGLKSEGVIPREQFLNHKGELNLTVGDQVKVAMEVVDDGFGETRLSREKAKRVETWEHLEEAYANKEPVKGVFSGRVKGGFTVNIDDVRAFLPGSLVVSDPTEDLASLEGQELEFQIIKLDTSRNNVVVSRRAILEAEHSDEREALLESLAEGQIRQGIVKNLTDYGAFVDLGGVDGLLHVTDMAWKRIRHPSQMLSVGQEVSVRVLSFDQERSRVSLGMKQLGDDPWTDIAHRYPPKSKVYATVTNITDYGCFAEIEDGIEGLVHVSEMDWSSRNVIPSKVVTRGDTVEVMVIEIDEERRRVSLGIKQCRDNPWELFGNTHEVGKQVRGIVQSITDFGIFLRLEGNVDGLVHISDISWTEPGETVLRRYSKGEEVDAIILAIDVERERIGLGIKQLDSDVFGDYLKENPQGSVVNGKVEEVRQKDATVRLTDVVKGIIRIGEISQERIEDVRNELKVDDEVTAKIINVDSRYRKIFLSLKDTEADVDVKAQREFQPQVVEETKTMTFGELIKSQLEAKQNDSAETAEDDKDETESAEK